MLTDEELAAGGYRFEDLLELRIVSGRTDLERKQKQHGFPKPVKTGERQAWFPKTEVFAWLRQRLAQRDQQTDAHPPEPPVKHKMKPARRTPPGARPPHARAKRRATAEVPT